MAPGLHPLTDNTSARVIAQRLGARVMFAGAALGLGLAAFTASAEVEATTPTRFSRMAIAMCQTGCDSMRDDQIRAMCKLKCFEDPNTATPVATRPAPSATHAQPAPSPTHAQPAPAPAKPSHGPASSSTTTSSKAHTGAGAATVRIDKHGAQPASDAAQCRRACDANTTLSETDNATCKLGCDTKGPSMTTWSVSGSPAQVRCAKKCHCESSCTSETNSCARSCDTMSNADSRASCKLQCRNKVSDCAKRCKPAAPTPDCSCG